MALSLSNFLAPILVILAACLIQGTHSATLNYEWNVGWVRRNPDGLADRAVIGINGEWPLPLLNFTKGDRVVVKLNNEVCPGLRTSTEHTLTSCSSATKAPACISTVCSKMAQTTWTAPSVSHSVISLQDSMTYNFTVRYVYAFDSRRD